MCSQRNENEMKSVGRHWNELGHICGGFTFLFNFFFKYLNRFRPVYSTKDFLNFISLLVNPNFKIDESL
ncbi:unnamed protein product [Rotaria sp. Silwood1]|nr:unnamed protein product [Rotaria sp. Silwood1]CAF3701074.1 unnamed protein product [Rotaria sp. Silwood1]